MCKRGNYWALAHIRVANVNEPIGILHPRDYNCLGFIKCLFFFEKPFPYSPSYPQSCESPKSVLTHRSSFNSWRHEYMNNKIIPKDRKRFCYLDPSWPLLHPLDFPFGPLYFCAALRASVNRKGSRRIAPTTTTSSDPAQGPGSDCAHHCIKEGRDSWETESGRGTQSLSGPERRAGTQQHSMDCDTSLSLQDSLSCGVRVMEPSEWN